MQSHSLANCSVQTESRLRYAVGSTRAFVTPTIVLLGVLGNALTIAIFVLEARLRPSGRPGWNRFGVWCVALAVSDTSVLIFSGFIDDFLGRGLAHVYGREVVKLDAASRVSCKGLEYLQNTTLFVSSYLLVFFSTDRLATVCQPIRLMTQRYVRHCVAAALSVALAGLVLMSPILWVYDLHSERKEEVLSRSCRIAVNCSTDSTSVAEYVLYFKTFGMFVVPCLLQVGLSLAIVAKLIEIKRLRRALMSSTQESDLEMSRYYANLIVSLAFCLLVGPLCVAIFLRTGCGLCNPHDTCWCHTLEQAVKLMDSVKDAYYAVNFWVYLICVRSFRHRVAVALAYGFVKMRLEFICPGSAVSRRAVEIVERMEMKRNPGAFLTQTTAASQQQRHHSNSVPVPS